MHAGTLTLKQLDLAAACTVDTSHTLAAQQYASSSGVDLSRSKADAVSETNAVSATSTGGDLSRREANAVSKGSVVSATSAADARPGSTPARLQDTSPRPAAELAPSTPHFTPVLAAVSHTSATSPSSTTDDSNTDGDSPVVAGITSGAAGAATGAVLTERALSPFSRQPDDAASDHSAPRVEALAAREGLAPASEGEDFAPRSAPASEVASEVSQAAANAPPPQSGLSAGIKAVVVGAAALVGQRTAASDFFATPASAERLDSAVARDERGEFLQPRDRAAELESGVGLTGDSTATAIATAATATAEPALDGATKPAAVTAGSDAAKRGAVDANSDAAAAISAADAQPISAADAQPIFAAEAQPISAADAQPTEVQPTEVTAAVPKSTVVVRSSSGSRARGSNGSGESTSAVTPINSVSTRPVPPVPTTLRSTTSNAGQRNAGQRDAGQRDTGLQGSGGVGMEVATGAVVGAAAGHYLQDEDSCSDAGVTAGVCSACCVLGML